MADKGNNLLCRLVCGRTLSPLFTNFYSSGERQNCNFLNLSIMMLDHAVTFDPKSSHFGQESVCVSPRISVLGNLPNFHVLTLFFFLSQHFDVRGNGPGEGEAKGCCAEEELR